jgi:hypothetical protein
MKKPSDTATRVWSAIRRIEARAERPTLHAVRDELMKLYGAGGSFREISPVLQAWREEVIEKASARINSAVVALARLRTDVEREEVVRRYRAKTGDDIRLTVTEKRRELA